MDLLDDLISRIPNGCFINGGWRDSATGDRFAVIDPASERTIVEVADASPQDGMDALDAAVAAQEEWADTSPRTRAELLKAGFDAIMTRSEDFALLMSLEMGKSLSEARGEVSYGAEFLRWFSEQACRVRGGYAPNPQGQHRILVTHRPVGPCLLITPWNFPLAMTTRKVGPALAAGCTVVVKPAALTPLTTLLFAQVMSEVGVPDGVINVVPTTAASAVTGPLIADSRLRKLSFTGSTEVGRALLKTAAPNVLRTSMELGGNAPFVVFEDADLDQAVSGAMMAKFRNIGQACTAANRFIVQESIADEFASRLSAQASSLRLGPGYIENNDLGPVINSDARERIAALVADALAKGAHLLSGGEIPSGSGFFYPPTVVTGVSPKARIMREEIFGPVAAVTTFADEEEAIRLANDSEFGLISYCFTSNFARMMRMIERLDSGMIAANSGMISTPAAPFGGVKHSGLGREGGAEGVEEYLETIYIGIGGL